MIFSLRLRMMTTVGLLAVAAVIAVALAARQRTRTEFRRFQELGKISASADPSGDAHRMVTLLAGRCCDADALRTAADTLSPNEMIVVSDQSDRVISSAGKPLDTISELRFSRNGGTVSIEATRRIHPGISSTISLRFRIDGVPLRLLNGGTALLYLLPFPDEERESPEAKFLGSVDRSLLVATILVAVATLLATWMLTRRISGPIEELREAARDLSTGNLGRRVYTSGSDEIAELGGSFNAMAAELERLQVLRRNLVHDVVHELRTPLAALRCRLDSVTDGISTDPQMEIAGANEEIDHLLKLVEDLHELALAEARDLKLVISEVPLQPLIESAARVAGLERDGRLRLALDNNLAVRGDAIRLRQVVLNMLSNAARYTPAEGTITVSARRRDRETVVEIHNTGSNLTADEMAQVFDRFYRTDRSRERGSGGTGLGLSIVKNLIEAQGGSVWSRSDDSGVTFAFALPSHL